MTLTDDEKRVLSVVTLQSDISVREIAQKLGLREHRVQYILKKLGADGVYYSYPFVNYHRLGYLEFNLFIAVKGGTGSARQKLLAKLKESSAVQHVGMTGGEYQIDVQILTRGIDALRDTLDNIAQSCVDVDYQVETLLLGSTTYFAANFLGVGPVSEDMVVITPTDKVYEADDLDRRIIAGLFTQALPNMMMLGKNLGVSQSTLYSRLERLSEEGVLMRRGYLLDHLKIGFSHVTLLVKAKRPSKTFTENLTKFCVQSRAACFLVECFGSWDYQLGVLFHDPTKMSLFVDLLFEVFGDQLDRVVPVPNFEPIARQAGL